MRALRVWVTGRPNGHGYLASVAMDIEIPGGFMLQVRGMRLIEMKDKQVRLAMPNLKDARGAWHDIFSPMNEQTRKCLEDAAIEAWKRQWPDPDLKDLLESL